MKGTVFELKRFAVHDGPGIRSTLFLKGCPLRCPWCQNPEGLSGAVRLWHKPSLCVMCGSCAAACPQQALSLAERVHIDQERCDQCGQCVKACPTGALSFDGYELTAGEALDRLMQDDFAYENGGITLSGGEALFQLPFARELLRLCHERGVDTALETSLYVPGEELDSLIPLVDHFLVDIKYFDSALHRQVIGVDNHLILANYLRLVHAGADVLVRTPLIPGFTASRENIRSIARFVAAADPDARYELLNFNPLCRSKYLALEMDGFVQAKPLTDEEMAVYYRILEEEGIKNIIRE